MNPSLQMLNWFWWKHRVAILMGFALVVIAQLAYWSGIFKSADGTSVIGGYLLIISFMGTALSAFTIFTFGRELNLTSGKSSFPQWFFGLPARTTRLALVPVIAMILSIAWAWCPFGVAMLNEQYIRNEAMSSQPYWNNFYFGVILPWLGMCGLATWIQAVAWWPYRSAVHRALLLFGLLVVISFLIAFGPGSPRWYASVVIIGSAVSGMVAALASVSWSRQRAWLAEQDSSSGVLAGLTSLATGGEADEHTSFELTNKSRFAAPETALHWRDWKQLGRIPVFMILFVVVSAFAGVLYAEKTMIGAFLFLAPIAICSMTSMTMGKNRYWKGVKSMSPFLAGLPISDSGMLRTRLFNVLRVSLTCWALVAVLFLVWFLRPGNREMLNNFLVPLGFAADVESGLAVFAAYVLFTLYLTIVLPISGLTVGLCGRKFTDVTAGLCVGLAGFLFFLFIANLAQDVMAISSTEEYRESPSKQFAYFKSRISGTRSVLFGLLIAKLCFLGVPITLQIRRGILNWKSIVINGALLIVACAAVIGIFWALLQHTNIALGSIALVITLLFPCSVFLMASLAVDWNRHR